MEAAPSMALHRPTTPEAVQEVVLAALEAGTPLAVQGAGTKADFGRPMGAAATLALDGLSGVVDYQPGELILVVRPGTPLAEVERTVAEAGQMLAFEPPAWHERATIGGVVACNLAGPRRFKAGAARDHLLGFTAVSGRGELIHGGGRVVKNVTGYDLSKLMCGSFGTLAVMTELILKALPAPPSERTVVVTGQREADALRTMIDAARQPHDVSGLAHLTAGCVLPPEVAGAVGSVPSVTLLRLEGPPASVRVRAEQLIGALGSQTLFVEDDESRALWRRVRELEPIPAAPRQGLWRLSLPATRAAHAGVALRRLHAELALFYDWGGAALWAQLPAEVDGAAVHAVAVEGGGHAELVRRDPLPGADTLCFTPLPPVQAQLNRNLKDAFDPLGVLNPGRLVPDW